MTTIQEDPNMDEFFDFQNAAHSLDIETSSFNADLSFADPQIDEGAFEGVQLFASMEEEQQWLDLQSAMSDNKSNDFADFPRWIDGMVVPNQSCAYCRRMKLHCKVLKEGLRAGACTSCVALARSCSLTHPDPEMDSFKDTAHRCRSNFAHPNGVDDDGVGCDGSGWCAGPIPETCISCRLGGLQCRITHNGGRSCSNCMASAFPCSLANDDIVMEEVSLGAETFTPSSELTTSRTNSNSNLVSLSSSENLAATLESTPKAGPRFSKESLRVLRGWLLTHASHPYPTDEEKENLRRQTGLNKTQIVNWLANARRRGKVRAPRSTSPSMHNNYANAMDIPRRSTPALQHMNPLERWKNSPPEHEAASVTAIAKAVTSTTFASESPLSSHFHSDESRSLWNVSTTNTSGTSETSGRSFASAFSHKSSGSFGSFGSAVNRGRRRRRKATPKPVKTASLTAPPKTYQCTFCTETFKTKHDWQRHEKSLHLSLERWVCCPDGPVQHNGDTSIPQCVFCSEFNPSADHAEVHNHSGCADRGLEERTFYRKDHLRQHLHLIHDSKFQAHSMEQWKVATPEIRSRCGFCGLLLGSWSIRIDHLAEHFKAGDSMANWKGDWGFDQQVLDIVENGIPPYLIHDERNSMNPFEASKESPTVIETLEDLVKLGLVDYIHKITASGKIPVDDDLLIEARKIIQNADSMSIATGDNDTWFRDLIMLSDASEETIMRYLSQTGLPYLKKLEVISARVTETRDLSQIICSKHRALITFVENRQALGLMPMDRELQIECCKILDETEMTANFKCKPAVEWFRHLIMKSSGWLCCFRKRCGLPRSSEIASEQNRSADEKSIDHGTHNHRRLVKELKEWTHLQIASGKRPTDCEIMSQARVIVYSCDDPWNQTTIEDPAMLHLFKRQAGLVPGDDNGALILDLPPITEDGDPDSMWNPTSRTLHWPLDKDASPATPGVNIPHDVSTRVDFDRPLHTLVSNQPSCNTNPTMPLLYFLNDANCYGRLVRELSRFVATCMSANNPNQHIPTDAELQNQARWVIYDDDDPWNQTAADNAEWLVRFKRDVGLAPREDGPGLPDTNTFNATWRVGLGGTGFSPPYACPINPPAVTKYKDDVEVNIRDKVYNIKAKTAEKFLETMQERWSKPAVVFCSREMEGGMNELVNRQKAMGLFPSDEELQAKAREILGVEETSAEDPILLAKFKAMHGVEPTPDVGELMVPFTIDDDMLAQFDSELGAMDFSDINVPLLNDMMASNIESPNLSNMDFDNMDFNNMSGLGDPNRLIVAPIPTDPSQISLIAQGLEMDNRSSFVSGWVGNRNPKMKPSKGPGMARDFAEMEKVYGATASPLRRRVSERMTAKAGIEMPSTLTEMLHAVDERN